MNFSKIGGSHSAVVLLITLTLNFACDEIQNQLMEEGPDNRNIDLKNLLKENIDLERSMIFLSPQNKERYSGRKLVRPEAGQVIDAVLKLNIGDKLKDRERRDSLAQASTKFYNISVGELDGKHKVQLFQEAEARIKTGRNVPIGEIKRIAASLCRSLGVREDEAVSSMKSLMAGTREESSGKFFNIREEGKFVLVQRTIGRIPVAGERISMLIDSDGLVRYMQGKWTPINFAESQLDANLTNEDVISKAVEELVVNGIRDVGDEKFTIRTHYAVEEKEPGSFTLKLRGSINTSSGLKDLVAKSFTFDLD